MPLVALAATLNVFAAADLEINTPGINAVNRHAGAPRAAAPHYNSGAVGLTADGHGALRDTGAVPYRSARRANALVAAGNNDCNALYAEIANASSHPEWQAEIRGTFAQRWMERAQPKWWVRQQRRHGSGNGEILNKFVIAITSGLLARRLITNHLAAVFWLPGGMASNFISPNG